VRGGAPVDWLAQRVPMRRRRSLAQARLRMRQLLPGRRALPDFLVIGVSRGGTSSLYKYLGMHPDVVPSLRKETGFFARRFDEGVDWYRAHFPLEARRNMHRRLRGHPALCFEASPGYLYRPEALPRIQELLPDARFVALLREPVQRVWSEHQHRNRFSDVGDNDPTADPEWSFDVEASEYAVHLERWFRAVGRDRVYVAASERLFRSPQNVYAEILEFLDLRPYEPKDFRNFSYRDPSVGAARASSMPAGIRAQLEEHFRAPNAALRALLPEADIPWLEDVSSTP